MCFCECRHSALAVSNLLTSGAFDDEAVAAGALPALVTIAAGPSGDGRDGTYVSAGFAFACCGVH